MQREQMPQKPQPGHTQQPRKIRPQHMCHTNLIMSMTFSHPVQISLKPILPLPPLNLLFHPGDISAEFEFLAVPEPDVVVRRAFEEVHALCFQRSVEVAERLFEEMRQQEEGGAVIEAVAIRMDEAATAASVGVFLEHGDLEARFGEAGGGGDAADTGAWVVLVICGWWESLGELTDDDGCLLFAHASSCGVEKSAVRVSRKSENHMRATFCWSASLTTSVDEGKSLGNGDSSHLSRAVGLFREHRGCISTS